MADFVVRKKIDLQASSEVVWKALTDPEQTKRYFFGCKVYSDWQVGSDISFKGRMFFFIPIHLRGNILQLHPQRLLQYTLANASSKDGSISLVTIQLKEVNGHTTLSVSDDVGKGKKAGQRYARSVKGWDKILKGMKEFIEQGKP